MTASNNNYEAPTDVALTTQPDDEVVETTYTPKTVIKKSNKPLIAGITAMVLLFTIVVAGFWAYNKFINRPTVLPARVLPANTLAYITIDPSPSESQKKALDNLGPAFQSRPGFKEAWSELAGQATQVIDVNAASSDFPLPADFESLANYLGSNLTLALMPPSTDDLESLSSSSGGDEELLSVLRRNVIGLVDLDFNPVNKQGPLPNPKRASEDEVGADVPEKYRGIEIRKYVSDTLTLYFSLLPDTSTAVVGADPAPVRTVIDQFVLDEGLKYDPTYKALVSDLPTESIATLYVNLTQINQQIRLMSDFADEGSSVEGQGAWMAALSGNPDGLQLNIVAQTEFDGAGTLLFGMPGINVEVNPRARPQVASLYDVPSDSLAFLVGTDFRSIAETAMDSLQTEEPESAAQVEAEIKENTGLNLRHDILPLLEGDYMLSVSASGTANNSIPSVVSQLKLSPESQSRALEVVPVLLEAFSTGGPVVQTTEMDSRFYVPMSSNSAVVLTSDRLIQVQDKDQTTAKEKAKRVLADLGNGFGGTDEWKAISKHLPVDSNLIAYADIKAVSEIVERNTAGEQTREYTQLTALLRPFSYLLIGSANYPNLQTREPKPISSLRSHTVIFMGITK